MRALKMLFLGAVLSPLCLCAQTMLVEQGPVTTAISADEAGDMQWAAGGNSFEAVGVTFAVASINKISTTREPVAASTVGITYGSDGAHVVVAGNVARFLTVNVAGGKVSILQSADLADEITYTLSGSCNDGSFAMDGELKATVVLNGLQLHNTSGAAINIDNGKRINVVVADGTTNTLSDGQGPQKACFFVNGHAEFSGAGTLTIQGNVRHAYRSDEYTQLKKSFAGTLSVTSAVSDGLHVGQYFKMSGGTVTVNGVSGDGLDVEVTKDPNDELNGQVEIAGGTLTVNTTADDVKALKADADIKISGGSLLLKAIGAGSKALSTGGALNVSGGKLEAITLGEVFHKGAADEAKPNAIKSTADLTISGGELYAVATGKALNTDAKLLINGGTVLTVSTKANASVDATSTQSYKTYVKENVAAGATVTKNGISYTVPQNYSCASAYVLVSPN